MDDAVRIVVVLFVAVVVGGTIILFSQRTLTEAEQQLYDFDPVSNPGLEVVTFPATATVADVQKLADACTRKFQGEVTAEECFVVKGAIPDPSTLDGLPAGSLTIAVDFAAGATALFIAYDPSGVIRITS
ncbi:MAG: hypothetical protein OXR66_06825 [Candidatus Woesearchaeota archaeon]|nr:hypothetical protein [Candidatus Woesearchaeota archaeon]